MNEWIDIRKDDRHVAREREKARALRKSAWWRQQLQKGVCHYCGRQVGADALTLDHVVPVARGGVSTKGNVVPACKACNSEKKYLTPAERILAELEHGAAQSGETQP
ncbi:MAG: HNH endonuclease [Lentisphaerae bacterium]|nr:HNH endonuclease [Lentisphaerota bacterium]